MGPDALLDVTAVVLSRLEAGAEDERPDVVSCARQTPRRLSRPPWPASPPDSRATWKLGSDYTSQSPCRRSSTAVPWTSSRAGSRLMGAVEAEPFRRGQASDASRIWGHRQHGDRRTACTTVRRATPDPLSSTGRGRKQAHPHHAHTARESREPMYRMFRARYAA